MSNASGRGTTGEKETSSLIHHELIASLINTGGCPNRSELSNQLNLPIARIEQALTSLAEQRGVVLHPHVCEPWVVHPFSTTPTPHWVESRGMSWWAPCIWCAFGIATLVSGETQIHTRMGSEAEPLVIRVLDGHPVGLEEVLVHFAIPPVRAWDNVHQHCSMVLPFHSHEDIVSWCERHKLPRGEEVPLHQVARLAQTWYGTHGDVSWHKWTSDEARGIFQRAGLVSGFWSLGEGRF
jgi:hypothetical protein